MDDVRTYVTLRQPGRSPPMDELSLRSVVPTAEEISRYAQLQMRSVSKYKTDKYSIIRKSDNPNVFALGPRLSSAGR